MSGHKMYQSAMGCKVGPGGYSCDCCGPVGKGRKVKRHYSKVARGNLKKLLRKGE